MKIERVEVPKEVTVEVDEELLILHELPDLGEEPTYEELEDGMLQCGAEVNQCNDDKQDIKELDDAVQE